MAVIAGHQIDPAAAQRAGKRAPDLDALAEHGHAVVLVRGEPLQAAHRLAIGDRGRIRSAGDRGRPRQDQPRADDRAVVVGVPVASRRRSPAIGRNLELGRDPQDIPGVEAWIWRGGIDITTVCRRWMADDRDRPDPLGAVAGRPHPDPREWPGGRRDGGESAHGQHQDGRAEGGAPHRQASPAQSRSESRRTPSFRAQRVVGRIAREVVQLVGVPSRSSSSASPSVYSAYIQRGVRIAV